MAVKKRKKRFAVRFDLGLGALSGLGVLLFCIFLWMFLLGIWAGQTVLSPESQKNKTSSLTRLAADIWQRGVDSDREPTPEPVASPAAPESEASIFSLQIGSFRDSAQAAQLVAKWREQGYTAFSIAPDEEGESRWRVFVGRFDNLADANAKAASLEKSEHVNAYITLLAADELKK